MIDVATWAEHDQKWLARYRRGFTGKPVPPEALAERERELLSAVGEARVPAAELFGDPAELAAEDVAELATVDEAVRTSEGGGLRPALREVGGTLVALIVVGVLLRLARGDSTVDVELASAAVAAGVAAVFVAWVVVRVLVSAGRPAPAAGVLVATTALAAGGVSVAARLGPGHAVARDVPVLLLGLVLLVPGVLVLALAARTPQPTLRRTWDDAEWLRRFHGGLRTRLVPAATAQGHVAEVEQAVRAGDRSAYAEFGHPLVLARRLAESDRTARARRWWLVTGARTVAPLAVAALVSAGGRWGSLTVPLVLVLVLAALLTPVLRWDDRPWAERP